MLNSEKYWAKRYEANKLPKLPSDFTVFVLDRISVKEQRIIDVGCGNGRDSYFLAIQGAHVLGIDYAVENKEAKRCKFDRISVDSMTTSFECNFEIVYSRFFLHSISDEQIENLIKWTKKYFIAEFRERGDEPIVHADHERNFIDHKKLEKLLEENNFTIEERVTGKNMALYHNENPLITRIIAKKNDDN